MARRSLEERLGQLEGRAAKMDAAQAPQPTEVHRKTVDVFAHLLSMGKTFSGQEVPTHLRVLLRTLDAARPTLEAELATVPEDQIVTFMAMIRNEIDQIVGASSAPHTEEQSA